MAILAKIPHNGNSIEVEVTDVFEGAGGRKLASVRATSGQPFQAYTHGGWAESDTANIPAGLLRDVRQDPQPAPNLLALALAAYKPAWYRGEAVWLWKGQRAGAFLKASEGRVCLCLTSSTKRLEVFRLGAGFTWQQAPDLEANYRKWASEVQR